MNIRTSTTNILDNIIELIIPNKDAVGNEIENSAIVTHLSKLICNITSGFRMSPADGIWINSQNELIYEKVIVLKIAFNEHQLPKLLAVVFEYYNLLTQVLKQETVAFTINGRMLLINTGTDKASLNNQLKAGLNILKK